MDGLSWFPNSPSKFVTWGQEINLYEVRPRESFTVKSPSLSGRFLNISVGFIASENRYQYARCVQPSYHKDRQIIAVGLNDGKICLSNFDDMLDSSWEYTPRQQRKCTCLAWSSVEPNLLAIGHERCRPESCITIWDIERGLPKDPANYIGLSEHAHSLCWDKHYRRLIAGISLKQIKLFDLRQSNTASQTIPTKTVNGLSVAPNGNYLCSFVDSEIKLYDLRALDRPLKQMQSSKNHIQISWCPTRTSLLSSLQRDTSYITFYDIRSVDVEASREVYLVKKQLQPFPVKNYSSSKEFSFSALAWHPIDYERALLLLEKGNILDYTLPLAIMSAYNNRNKIPLLLQNPQSAVNTPSTSGSQDTTSGPPSPTPNFNVTSEILDKDLLNDDVEDSRQRALNDYGLKMDIKRFDHLNLSPYLRNIWINLSKLYKDDKLTGLKTTLGISLVHTSEALMAGSRVESNVIQWPDFINNSNNLIVYRSDQRDVATELCGWALEKDFDRFIARLCENKDFSRAAMICVFDLKILLACDILSKVADISQDPSMYRIAAIALSSFNADRCSTTWRQQRTSANMQIQDPHLRTIFSFLTIENENFDTVLNENEIALTDRVAFACKYLSENKLSEFIKQQIHRAIEKGDLNGLLLAGASNEGINILQAYMDATFDIQTVALIAINYFHREFYNDNRIKYWMDSYLECLNSWGLWEKRAELEIKIENKHATSRSTPSVYLSCNFCGKSVSNALQEDIRLRTAASNINKLSSCPSCRKPLPRCSLCLLHMGTTMNSISAGESGHESLGWQSKPFAKWFSWCQTCRHGGHTEHILQWFKQNVECPVSSCSCRCFDLDAAIPLYSRDNS